ncbi:MAG: transcriptional regulator, partial [Burkholderiales bacterium]|nr:transcriptional regulator [Burkholderiales bacterium]
HRGNTGGYTLALPPTEITVADVIQVVHGPISLVTSRSPKSVGDKY